MDRPVVPPPEPALGRLGPALLRQHGGSAGGAGDTFVEVFTLGQRLPNVEGGTAHLIQRFVRFHGRLHPSMWLDAPALAGIRQPTLFIAGEKDVLGGLAAGRRMVGAIPGAELRGVGRGHLPWLQDAEGVGLAIRDFLHSRITVHG